MEWFWIAGIITVAIIILIIVVWAKTSRGESPAGSSDC